jgi:hypothetical protein
MDVQVSGSSEAIDIYFDSNGNDHGLFDGNTYFGRVFCNLGIGCAHGKIFINNGYGLVTAFIVRPTK